MDGIYEPIPNIQFSEKDCQFIQQMADTHDLLEPFRALFTTSTARSSSSSVRITSPEELGDYLKNRSIDIFSSGWDAFFARFMVAATSELIKDIQIHLFRGKPTGQARRFFKKWLEYYDQLRQPSLEGALVQILFRFLLESSQPSPVCYRDCRRFAELQRVMQHVNDLPR